MMNIWKTWVLVIVAASVATVALVAVMVLETATTNGAEVGLDMVQVPLIPADGFIQSPEPDVPCNIPLKVAPVVDDPAENPPSRLSWPEMKSVSLKTLLVQLPPMAACVVVEKLMVTLHVPESPPV